MDNESASYGERGIRTFIPPQPNDPAFEVNRHRELFDRLFFLPEKSPHWGDTGSPNIDDPLKISGAPMPVTARYNQAVQTAFNKGIVIESYQQLIRDTANPVDWFDAENDADIAWCWEFSAVIGKHTPLEYLLKHGTRRFVVAQNGHDYKVAALFPGGKLPVGAREPTREEGFEDYCEYLADYIKQSRTRRLGNPVHISERLLDDEQYIQMPFIEHLEGPSIQPYGSWHLVPIRGEEYRSLAPLTFDRILCHDRAYEPSFVVDLPLEDADVDPSECDDPPRFEPRLYLMLMTGFRRIIEGQRFRASGKVDHQRDALPSDCRNEISRWLREAKILGSPADFLYTRDSKLRRVSFEDYLKDAAFPSFLSFIQDVAGVGANIIRQLEAQGVVSRLDLSLAFYDSTQLSSIKGVGSVTAERLKGLAIPPETIHQISSHQKALEADPYIQSIF